MRHGFSGKQHEVVKATPDNDFCQLSARFQGLDWKRFYRLIGNRVVFGRFDLFVERNGAVGEHGPPAHCAAHRLGPHPAAHQGRRQHERIHEHQDYQPNDAEAPVEKPGDEKPERHKENPPKPPQPRICNDAQVLAGRHCVGFG